MYLFQLLTCKLVYVLNFQKHGSLCVFAQKMKLFTPCPLPPGTKCPTLEKVKFTCCPANCVSTIMACHIGKPLNDICIPTDLTRKRYFSVHSFHDYYNSYLPCRPILIGKFTIWWIKKYQILNQTITGAKIIKLRRRYNHIIQRHKRH